MEYRELKSSIGTLVDALARRSPELGWSSVRHLIDAAELHEATDVAVAILVRDRPPISRAEHHTLRALIRELDLRPQDAETYLYLADPEMLDRMTVVDGSS